MRFLLNMAAEKQETDDTMYLLPNEGKYMLGQSSQAPSAITKGHMSS